MLSPQSCRLLKVCLGVGFILEDKEEAKVDLTISSQFNFLQRQIHILCVMAIVIQHGILKEYGSCNSKIVFPGEEDFLLRNRHFQQVLLDGCLDLGFKVLILVTGIRQAR